MSNLKGLFEEAEKYGTVRVFGSEDEQSPYCYHATITFSTIKHVTLKADSERYDHTIDEALRSAIRRAVEIVNSVQKTDIDTKATMKLIGSADNE